MQKYIPDIKQRGVTMLQPANANYFTKRETILP